MDKILLVTLAVIGVVVLGVGLALLFAWPTLLVTNYLIAPSALQAVFGISQITFWKAFWLNFICGTLFKGTTTNTDKK